MPKRRNNDSFNIAFLDVMSCGFGAMILLLMITRVTAPIPLETSEISNEGSVLEMQEQLFEIRGETNILNRELNAKHEQLSEHEERIARLRRELSSLEDQLSNSTDQSSVNSILEGQLALAQQELTAEMERLQANQQTLQLTDSVGGVPVDSEYIIFIIDTSGSMYNYSWSRLLEVVIDTLDIYPEVKGIQVLNDMGDYMFNTFRGDWIPDTPARRSAIIQRLRTWNPFSNSSPVEGITYAINAFYEPDKKISIYVLGDDFSGNSIADVVDTVDRINRVGADGERLVRIHGIGFPVQFAQPRMFQTGGIRFAALMRELAKRNGGTFVGLNDFY
ncbi:MAG: hypothetical protein CMQ38_09680 [Gammaproteobacteria bacterium]|nr:hypothetical protein [Gammaproteobacteria bacterium]